MNVTCLCFHEDRTVSILQECIRFSLLRDRYLPFASMSAQFHTASELMPPVRVQLFIRQRLVHDGLVRHASAYRKGGQYYAEIQSRGFSSVLTKNQLVPGIHTDVTLDSLMETYNLPHVTYQDNMQAIGYIYVKDNATMWDSVIAYNYKLNRGYPYVRVPNLLCVMPRTGGQPVPVPESSLLSAGSSIHTADMLSRIDMANAAGEYGTFTLSNPLAEQPGIVRVRQILFDKQFAHAPTEALRFRIAVGNRKFHARSFSYAGYCGEDLEDTVQIGNAFSAKVSRIDIRGDATGIVTEDTFYFDDFCNPAAQ